MRNIIFCLFIFLSSLAIAEDLKINEKYSYKDFMDKSFVNVDVSEFNDTIIKGSCFYQQGDVKKVFPEKIKNVIFENCNIDNIYFKGLDKNVNPKDDEVQLPNNIILRRCTAKRIKYDEETDENYIYDKVTDKKIEKVNK